MVNMLKKIIFGVIIILFSLVSFYLGRAGGVMYFFLLIILLFSILISITSIILSIISKKINILCFLIIFSIITTFIGEINRNYVNKYFENEIIFFVNEIENYYINTNEKNNIDELLKLFYNYDHNKSYFRKSNDGFGFSSFRRRKNEPLLNIGFTFKDDYYIIRGITQTLGIPGLRPRRGERLRRGSLPASLTPRSRLPIL